MMFTEEGVLEGEGAGLEASGTGVEVLVSKSFEVEDVVFCCHQTKILFLMSTSFDSFGGSVTGLTELD